ncbi:hypothetical protein D3C81_485380 [compost metagenome]
MVDHQLGAAATRIRWLSTLESARCQLLRGARIAGKAESGMDRNAQRPANRALFQARPFKPQRIPALRSADGVKSVNFALIP